MSNLATWHQTSVQVISRSAGRSAVAAAAYRACAKFLDETTGITHDFTPKKKNGLVANICVGIKNNDMQRFWNDVEKAETRKNSTVAREFLIPLSNQWTEKQQYDCVEEIAQMLHTRYKIGVVASIHKPPKPRRNSKQKADIETTTDKSQDNGHAHILTSTRELDDYNNEAFGKKGRALDDLKTGEIAKVRKCVADIVNRHAITNGNDWFVTSEKFSNFIEDHIPTHHISINHGKNQKKYIDQNRRDVKEARSELAKLKKQIADTDEKISELSKPSKFKYQATINAFGDPPLTEEELKQTNPRITDKELIELAYNAPEPANEWVWESDEEKIERVASYIEKAMEDDGPVMIPAQSTINGPHIHRETTAERAKRLAIEALGLSHVIK